MVGLDFKLPPEEQITAAAAGQTRIKWDERIAGHVNDADNKVKELVYDGIVQGQSYSDVAKGIKERFDVTATKAEMIARTESHRAREMGNMAATIEAAGMGINMMRRWLATLDGRTRDTHGAMDGQEIPVFDDNGEFAFFKSPTGATALYPGGFGIAAEDIRCRCDAVDIVKGYEPTTRRARDEFGRGEVIPYTNFTQYAQSKGWVTPYAGVEPRVVEIIRDTAWLFDSNTGKEVQSVFESVSADDVKNLKKDGWKFDWKKPIDEGYEVKALKIAGDDSIQGLIAYEHRAKESYSFIHLIETSPANMGSAGRYTQTGPRLVASVVNENRNMGFGGYASLEAKTGLFDHYSKTLGAVRIGAGQTMAIDERAADILIKKYF